MTTPRHILLAVAAGVCALGATAATASATTYCVDDAACWNAGGTPYPDVQKALDQAQIHAGPDVVKLGAGNFSGGPYVYTDGSGANPVELRGAGQGSTTLTAAPVQNQTVVRLRSNSKVSDLRVAIPASSNTGIELPDVATAERVSVVSSDPQSSFITGVKLYGGTVDHSTVDLPMGSSTAVSTIDAFPITLTDDTLNAVHGATIQSGGSGSKVERVRVHAEFGVEVHCGAVTVEDSLVDVAGPGGAGVTSTPDQCGNAAVAVRESTLVANPGTSAFGVFTSASVPGQTASAAVSDTIIKGFERSIERLAFGGITNIDTDFSAYDQNTVHEDVGNGGQGALTQTNHLGGDPAFVNPGAGDYHLGTGSALIDAGSPGGLLAGESSGDLTGATRIIDGDGVNGPRRDPGAFESQFVPAVGSPAPTATSATTTTAAQTTAPRAPRLRLTGSKRQKALRGKRIVVTAITDQPARLRARGTIRVGRKSVSLRAVSARAMAAGKGARLTLKLRRTGTLRSALAHHRRVTATVTVVATNAAGKTATATRRITITR